MSEEAQEITLPVSRQDAIAAAAAAADIDTPDEPGAPLTTEDVAGSKPAGPAADRQLVAPSVREFLRAQTPEVAPTQTALEKEISDLRGALDGLAGKKDEPLSVEQQTFEKLQALEARELERIQADKEAKAEEEYDNRMRSMREGVAENINAKKEDYPGLVALEQQETVFNALVQRSQDGLETSEDEIASEVEEGLRTVYKTLHGVYGSTTPSEDSKPASEPKVTLTPSLAGTTEAADIENMSRSERIEYLWNKTHKQE
jgi:Skp family chaperone for outer membrane proteins